MKTKIELKEKKFLLRTRLIEQGVRFPYTDDKDQTLHNHFLIIITRLDKDKKRVSRLFDFYDSQADYESGKDDLTEEDLIYAFRYILEDAIEGANDFYNFCKELGYDEDSRRAERIYKLCRKTLKKIKDLGVMEEEINDFLNILSERGIE